MGVDTKEVSSDNLGILFTQIADAIREKDGTTDSIVASTFPERIRAISAGGYPALPPNPLDVYRATRPADWLTMPEPQDDEIYLLFHIPDGASALLAFTATCTGSYTVALGTVVDGQFVQQSAMSVASAGTYEAELFSADFGNLTSDGMKQCMVKVTGTVIKTWAPAVHSKKTAPTNFTSWNIVEIVCRLPSGTKVSCGTATTNKALGKLRYFSWKGNNKMTTASNMFYNCLSMLAVLELDTALVTNMSYMFYYCRSLTAIPEMNTALVTNMSYMFQNCFALVTIPSMNTAKVTNMSRMFNSCYALTEVPHLETANVTNMGYLFYGCCALVKVPEMNTAKVSDMSMMLYGCTSLVTLPTLSTALATNLNGTFQNCYALSKVTLDPTVTGWAGYALSFSNCSLGHQALVEMFNSLPVLTEAKALTITGNPGVSELTDDEKAIATGKNWTLTL